MASFNIMCYQFLLIALLLVGIPSTRSFQQSRSPHSRQLHGSQLFETPEKDAQRRKLLTTATTTTAGWLLAGGANTARADNFPDTRKAESAELPVGLLESRVLDNVLSPPPYGMESPDVYYPSWFSGQWKVVSECTDVVAPCGVAFFGGNRTYAAAIADKGLERALRYESRFLSSPSASETGTIADREYNVKSIARIAMGVNSVVDISLATPNKFSCLLLPDGAPSMMTVDLLVLNRRQEKIDDTHFDCSEVVREIVSPVDKGVSRKTSTVLKEIETTSLYTLKEDGSVSCRQRSATFLLPSQDDPMALQMWQATRGRPIDVRFYDVRYTRG